MVPCLEQTANELPERIGMKGPEEVATLAFAAMYQAKVWVV
jgi:hypothetical protein